MMVLLAVHLSSPELRDAASGERLTEGWLWPILLKKSDRELPAAPSGGVVEASSTDAPVRVPEGGAPQARMEYPATSAPREAAARRDFFNSIGRKQPVAIERQM